MPIADWTTIPIHGKWERMDGTPESGRVTFTPTVGLFVDGATQSVVTGMGYTAGLDTNGEITISLPATNDPDITGQPFAYNVAVELSSAVSRFLLAVPFDTIGTIELASVTPATLPSPPPTTFVQSINGHSGILTTGDVSTERRSRYLAAVGLIAESFPLTGIAGSNTLTTQLVYGVGIYLFAGETATGIAFNTAVAGTSTAPAGFKVGLWDSAATPTILVLSSDKASDACLTTIGPMRVAFTTPYVVPTDGYYYASAWQNGAFAGTALKLSGVAGLTGQQSLGGAGTAAGLSKRFTTALKTTAALSVSDTGTYANTGGVWPWLAVY